ncbi:MAG: glycerate kinase [Pseudomonadota bacterium]
MESFKVALAAADPQQIIPQHLPTPPKGRTIVVGAGKAAASMAKAVEDHWPQDLMLEGLVVTRYGHSLPTQRIRVIEAGHPVPDEQGEKAAKEILALTQSAQPEDLVLVLVSGGGSSLLSLPAANISIPELRLVTQSLLKSGAPIQDMNTVRKHLSAIQGGRLAVVSKAPVRALIISDVPGDDPTHVASGPCAPDPSTYTDAVEILKRYDIDASASIKTHLAKGLMGEVEETPKPGDLLFSQVENCVVASAHLSLNAAVAFFQQRGITPVLLGDSVAGEAREVAKVYGALTRQIRQHNHPFKTPVALISGGETTVTVRGNGLGGRCSEFLLSLAIDLNKLENVYALAADTDGIDGSEDNAGAIITPDTLTRSRDLGFSAKALLANNNAYSFFASLRDLVITGPTRTNVNEYRAILIL